MTFSNLQRHNTASFPLKFHSHFLKFTVRKFLIWWTIRRNSKC